jgi:hypothetical protein
MNPLELYEAYSAVYAPQQIDELSVNKMLAYKTAAEKNRADLNKKWDNKTASYKEKMRVLGREEGEERASQNIKKKTGKHPHEMNALDKARYAVTKEDVDIFDVVLEFLYVEGYAETLEEAEWMMANIIDEEAIAIVLGEEELDEADSLAAMQARREKRQKANMKKHGTPGFDYSKPPSGKKGYLDAITKKEEYVDESQHARENPEKYEREQAKKSAPVRGERTPMPPRGDKRREDFEKWYAKNVR